MFVPVKEQLPPIVKAPAPDCTKLFTVEPAAKVIVEEEVPKVTVIPPLVKVPVIVRAEVVVRLALDTENVRLEIEVVALTVTAQALFTFNISPVAIVTIPGVPLLVDDHPLELAPLIVAVVEELVYHVLAAFAPINDKSKNTFKNIIFFIKRAFICLKICNMTIIIDYFLMKN